MYNEDDILKSFTENFVKMMVSDPNKVEINTVRSTQKIIIQIDVPKEERGRIIGKKARTIDSLKHLLIGLKNTRYPDDKRKITLEIIEEEQDYFLKKM